MINMNGDLYDLEKKLNKTIDLNYDRCSGFVKVLNFHHLERYRRKCVCLDLFLFVCSVNVPFSTSVDVVFLDPSVTAFMDFFVVI